MNSEYPSPMAKARLSSRDWQRGAVLLIAAFIAGLAGLSAIIPADDVTAHNILHHLNFLPLMIAGMLFGVRGAIAAALFAGAVNAPGIAGHWIQFPLDAKDQVLELTIFSAAGLIAGLLSDRERAQRRNLERTQQELNAVYNELQSNVYEMKKTERLSAAGQLAASLAHEIRNPLASISGAAGILQRGTAPAQFVTDSLEIIQKESQRLNKLLSGFLNFANPRPPRLQKTQLDELLRSIVSLAAHTADSAGVQLHCTSNQDDLELACDPEQMKQVLLNLVINAIEASPAGSEVDLVGSARNGRIVIEVQDKGSGILSEDADRIFDPFFTTKAKGTGLGLAISSMIISQHSGSLTFHPNPAGGTTFRIELPPGWEMNHVN